MTAAPAEWLDALAERPAAALAATAALAAATVLAGLGLRALTQRARSLRRQVLAVTLASLLLGAAGAAALAELMVLGPGELAQVVAVLGLTALCAVGLVLIASAGLGRDVRRLEGVVRRLEAGDRSVRAEIRRADELGHVARALDELTARLDSLERERAGYEAERSALLSSIGHDLRTPLAALRAAVEALADGVAPDPARYLRSMQNDVRALGALVEDFFLLARIESGRADVQPLAVDLAEIADEAVEALAPVATGRGVVVEAASGEAVLVRGNPAALGRVVRNLLDNAIRHAPPGSRVRVVLEGGDRPTVRVLDEGPGFPPGFSSRAFDRFTRADASRNRESGGAGLGLAIARGLVEAHGGSIWVLPPPGGGVAFELPAA